MARQIQLVDLKAFEARLGKGLPGFEVRFKDESTFMKLLGFLMFLFNPHFMTSFTTTVGKKVYFVSKKSYEANPEASFRTLAHEYVHIWDNGDAGFWFGLSYLFPQVLVVLPLLVFAVLAWPHTWLVLVPFIAFGLASLLAKKTTAGGWVLLGVGVVGTVFGTFFLLAWWKALVMFGGLTFLAPWPAPWRTKWELRGYSMSLAFVIWRTGVVPDGYRENCIKQFTGSNYYFMSWRREPIERSLDVAIHDAGTGVLQGRSPFSVVYEFLVRHELLHG